MSSVATELSAAADGVLGGYSSSDDASFSPDAGAVMVPPGSIDEESTARTVAEARGDAGHARISRSAAMWFVFLGCSTNVVWNALQINVQYYALATSPPLGLAGLSALGTAQDAGTTVGVGLGLLFTIKASRDEACKACRAFHGPLFLCLLYWFAFPTFLLVAGAVDWVLPNTALLGGTAANGLCAGFGVSMVNGIAGGFTGRGANGMVIAGGSIGALLPSVLQIVLLLAAPTLTSLTRVRVLLGLAAAVVIAGFIALQRLGKMHERQHFEAGHPAGKDQEKHLLEQGEGELLLDGSRPVWPEWLGPRPDDKMERIVGVPPRASFNLSSTGDATSDVRLKDMRQYLLPVGDGGKLSGGDGGCCGCCGRGSMLARLGIIKFNLIVANMTWLAALLVLGLSLRFKVDAPAGSFFSSQLPTALIVCFNAFTFAGNLVADRCTKKSGSGSSASSASSANSRGNRDDSRKQTAVVFAGLAVETACVAFAVALALQDQSMPGGNIGGVFLLFGLYAVIAFVTGAQSVLHSSAAQDTCASRDPQLSSVAGTAVWAAVQSGVMIGIVVALFASGG